MLLYKAVSIFFEVLYILIFLRIILSWFTPVNNKYYRLLIQITEPILSPFRNLLFKLGAGGCMFDFSPILALFALDIIKRIIITIIW